MQHRSSLDMSWNGEGGAWVKMHPAVTQNTSGCERGPVLSLGKTTAQTGARKGKQNFPSMPSVQRGPFGNLPKFLNER